MARDQRKKLKRILFITNGFPLWGQQGAGGIGEFTYTMARALSSSGIKVYVLGCSKDVHKTEHHEQPNLISQVIPFIRYSIGAEYLNRLRLNYLMFKYVLLYKIQIVETASYLGWVWPFKPPVPLVVRLHSASTVNVIDSKTDNRLPRRIAFEFKLIHKASVLVSVCDYVREALLSSKYLSRGKEIRVIYNGINTEKYSPPDARPGENHILSVGNAVPSKGINDTLQAWEHVLSAHDAARLTIIGSTQSEFATHLFNRYESFINQSVSFLGVIRNADLPEYYRSANLFISSSHFEANPLVVIEAMACGCAVICPDHSGFQEIITPGVDGILCDTTNENELAEKINELLENKTLREELGRNARNTVLEKFNINLQARQNILLYEELLNRKSLK